MGSPPKRVRKFPVKRKASTSTTPVVSAKASESNEAPKQAEKDGAPKLTDEKGKSKVEEKGQSVQKKGKSVQEKGQSVQKDGAPKLTDEKGKSKVEEKGEQILDEEGNPIVEKEYKGDFDFDYLYSRNPDELSEEEDHEAEAEAGIDESINPKPAIDESLINPEPAINESLINPDSDIDAAKESGFGLLDIDEEDLPAGEFGKVLIYESGKVKFKLGDVLYDVSLSTMSNEGGTVAAVNTEAREFADLGPQLVANVTPDSDSLLEQSAMEEVQSVPKCD